VAEAENDSRPLELALELEMIMDEHEDDLSSEVHEGADEETDAFPDTGDELDDPDGDAGEEPNLDEDSSEL
jgi:hypothetical protein